MFHHKLLGCILRFIYFSVHVLYFTIKQHTKKEWPCLGKGKSFCSHQILTPILWERIGKDSFLFVNSFTEIQFTYHTIHSFKLQNSTIFGIFTELQQSILEYFHHLEKKPCTLQLSSPIRTSPGNHKSTFCLHSPILDISYKLNHIACDLLCLAYFTQYVFKVHACCGVYQYFIPFYDCIDRPHYIYPSSISGHLGCFYILAIINNATVNIHV